MENEKIRWKLRLENFAEALQTITENIPRYKELSELEKDGIIQRFEFTFELAWKVMQDYLKQTGYKGLRGPRPTIIQMAQDGLIEPFVWDEILEARNELSHIYNEEKSREYFDKIIFDYHPVLLDFKNKMQSLQ